MTTTAKDAGATGSYSRALGLHICDRTAAGAAPRSLRRSPLNVRQRDLRAWLDENPEFAALFGLACAAGAAPLRYNLSRAADFCGRVAAGAVVAATLLQEETEVSVLLSSVPTGRGSRGLEPRRRQSREQRC